MASTVAVMTRVSPDMKNKLRAIAKSCDRSEAYLAREAIEQFVAANDWQVALIHERLAEVRAGGETIPHEKVVQRFTAKRFGAKTSTSRKPVSRRR